MKLIKHIFSGCVASVFITTAFAQDFEPEYIGGYPTAETAERMFEEYGQDGCIVVSTSDPIPEKGSARDKKSANPPHRQAANYYREDVVADDDDFKVTMEHPSQSDPSPLVIQIDRYGSTIKKVRAAAAFVATTSRAPRAG